MLHAIVMAGGTGTRFWPESRAARPKQLLRLAGSGRSMIQLTLDRVRGIVPPERTLVVTAETLVPAMREQLPELPAEAILGEPCKRDTAPCIGLAALLVSRGDPDATMLVLPADHVIEPAEAFHAAVRQAAALVDSADQEPRIVTFGVQPTYPAEIFGYIERGEPLPAAAGDAAAFRVAAFREKPPRKTAEEYLASGKHLWNAGIFVWKAKTILQALRDRQGEMLRRLQRIGDAAGTQNFDSILAEEFPAIQGISIDYAVMEHARDVVVIQSPFSWDDVGGWQALARLRPPDGEGNVVFGKHLGLNTRDCIIRGAPSGKATPSAREHLIVTLGLSNCIVVHTPDATLVANKDDEESIRQVVKLLEERGWREYL